MFPKALNGKYQLEWFYLIGGLFLILRYCWILDDAYVYYRYIDNFLFLDIGFVYNKGEYVEGFSSPLWAILLSIVRLTRIDYWHATQLIGCISFICFWLMLIKLNRMLSPKSIALNFPLAYLSFNYGVLCYFTSGLESPLVQVAAIAYALYIMNPTSRTVKILLAISPLIRHELALPLIICLLWTWFRYKKFPWHETLLSICIVGAYIIFRIYYYADLFPCTFYLKNIYYLKQGLVYFWDTVITYHLYLVFGIFVLLIFVLRKSSKNIELYVSKRLMMILVAASITLYVIKIGGDPRHYRFLAFPFCLFVCSLAGLMEHFAETFNLIKYKRQLYAAMVIVSFITFSFYPPHIDKHPFFLDEKHTITQGIADASVHRKRESMRFSLDVESLLKYKEMNDKFEYNDVMTENRCVDIYKMFDKRIIHKLGLTDAILARIEMESERTAHKYGLIPFAYSIVAIHKLSDNFDRGIYRKMVEKGMAARWITKNLKSIEIIERKIYNKQNFVENLKLAFTFPPKIKP